MRVNAVTSWYHPHPEAPRGLRGSPSSRGRSSLQCSSITRMRFHALRALCVRRRRVRADHRRAASDAAEPGAYPVKPRAHHWFRSRPAARTSSRECFVPRLSEKLGQSFVVENRPGAGSVAGHRPGREGACRRLYGALLLASHAANRGFYEEASFDPVRDFESVASIGAVPFVLVTHPTLPVKSVKGVRRLRQRRASDRLFYSSAGTGGNEDTWPTSCSRRKPASRSRTCRTERMGPMLTALPRRRSPVRNAPGERRAGDDTGRQGAHAGRRGLAAHADGPGDPDAEGIRRRSSKRHLCTACFRAARRARSIEVLNREINAQLQDAAFREPAQPRAAWCEDVGSPQEFASFIKAEISKLARRHACRRDSRRSRRGQSNRIRTTRCPRCSSVSFRESSRVLNRSVSVANASDPRTAVAVLAIGGNVSSE